MKTGLLTFYHIHHYGAVLQAAALTDAVERLGSDCEIPDYYVRQSNVLFRLPSSPALAASDLHTALHYPALCRRYRRFREFQNQYLHITPRRFRTLEQLREEAPDYDLLLCGSDQIWNPTIFPDGQFDPVFFGAFSPARKAAYAPSFGIPKVPEDMEVNLKTLLAPFSHLSARETAGQSILRHLTGREAPVVLDPTLLSDAAAWEALSAWPGGYPEGAYVLCYCISHPGLLSPYLRALAKQTGLPVVQLCGVRRRAVPRARCVLDAGPAEFLGLFRHAAAVVTNSFHGTVFSIQFHKPFFAAVHPRELEDPENARTYGLLRRLGLEDRIAGTGHTAPLDGEIDWEAVDAILREERAASVAYLSDTLLNRHRPRVPSQSPRGSDSRGTDSPGTGGADSHGTGGINSHGADFRSTGTHGELLPQDVDTRNPFPPTLAGWRDCTGCTACLNICPRGAIAMEPDQEGFLRPAVREDRCVRCGKCTAVCPPLHRREAGEGRTSRPEAADGASGPAPASRQTAPASPAAEQTSPASPAAEQTSPASPASGQTVRPAPASGQTAPASPAVYAAWNRDETVRRESSSGGVFTALAEYVLREGGVVYGAALDRRQHVGHTACFRSEDLGRLRGAKYVQSDLQETFRLVKWTLEKRPVLFSGTPCQVDGLYRYLGERPENLLTCDIICHGVPSPGVWEDLVDAWREERLLDVTGVKFRDKGQGEKYGSLTVSYENGASVSAPLYETEYGRAFGRSLFLRPCCYRCAYASLDRMGDFTLGDFWGLRRDEFPEEQKKGISLLLVNTPKASRVFDRLPLECQPFPVERAVEGNPNLSRPTACPPDRAEFFAAYALEDFQTVREKYLTVPPPLVRRAKKLLSPALEALRKRRA